MKKEISFLLLRYEFPVISVIEQNLPAISILAGKMEIKGTKKLEKMIAARSE